MVANSFSSLIPMAIISIIFLALKLIIGMTPYGDIHAMINTVIGGPLTVLTGSVWGYLIALFLTNLLWIFRYSWIIYYFRWCTWSFPNYVI